MVTKQYLNTVFVNCKLSPNNDRPKQIEFNKYLPSDNLNEVKYFF